MACAAGCCFGASASGDRVGAGGAAAGAPAVGAGDALAGGAGSGAAAAPASPMTPSCAPTSMVWSSPTVISSRVPATGEGISVSTLSVDTSTIGSSSATSSPTALSHRVTVPSVTDSPISGSVTDVPDPVDSPVPAVGFCAGASASVEGASAGAACAAGAASGSGAGSGAPSPSGGSSPLPPDTAPPPPAEPEPSPMIASSAPSSAVSSSPTRIFSSTPPYGDGISVSTLSVDTSSNGSSTSICSPSLLSQRVTVPSVTLSPRAGIWTEWDMRCSPTSDRVVRVVCGCSVPRRAVLKRGLWRGASVVDVQRFACHGEHRLAYGLVLRRVPVHHRRHVLRVGLPADDQLGLADQLADPRTDHVHPDDRAVLDPDHLDPAGRLEDLGLAVAAEIVDVGFDLAVNFFRHRLGQTDGGGGEGS